MLRINLLPPYIYDRQKRTQVAALWGVICLAVLAAFLWWGSLGSAKLSQAKNDLDTANQYQQKYTNLDNEINSTSQKIADIKSKEDFVTSAQHYNDSWPRVYEVMAAVVSPSVTLDDMAVSSQNHQQINFTGFCSNEMDLARWWEDLRNNTTVFQTAYISLPPHPYPAAGAIGTGAGFGAGGFGGPGGMRPGMGGFPGAGLPGMPGAGGPGMMGGPGGKFGALMGGPGGPMGSAMGGRMGGPMGGGQNGGQAAVTQLEGRKGIAFSGSVTVNPALAPPDAVPYWPAATGSGAGQGFGGMGGGMPGTMGMPGMGPGGPMGPMGPGGPMGPMGPGGPGGPMAPGGPGGPMAPGGPGGPMVPGGAAGGAK